MTRDEWLRSDDPAAMLQMHHPRDAELRLWVEACRGFLRPPFGPPWAGDLDKPGYLQATVRSWCDADAYRQVPMPLRRHLLREVLGDPFRPVTMPKARLITPGLRAGDPDRVSTEYCPWLTPLVLSLAQAAAWRECEECEGEGKLCEAGAAGYMGTMPPSKAETYIRHSDDRPCEACGGAGRLANATLDNDRLAVLSDALEEAGCDSEDLLMHLRGREPVLRLMGNAVTVDLAPRYRLAGWRPLRGPHPRACWAMRLLLGGGEGTS